MFWFCSVAHFNESTNASGRLESSVLGGLALPVSGALMFNYHIFFIHLLLFLWVDFLPRGEHVHEELREGRS